MSFDSFDSETSADGKKKGQKKAKKSNKSKAAQRKNSKKPTENQAGNDLSAKIFATMEKHKEVFFVIRLHSAQSAASLAVSTYIFKCNWGVTRGDYNELPLCPCSQYKTRIRS